MSEAKRIDPRRPYRITPAGLRRIVLGDSETLDGAASELRESSATKAKPLRTRQLATRWHMAVAHSFRGLLDDHAREAIAAAAILATSETGVVAVILGEFHEDAAVPGADKIIVIPDLDASRFQPRREEAIVEAIIDQFAPVSIFMPDNMQGDGDLGRRLIARERASAAAHVSELDAHQVSVRWSGSAVLAHTPLPRFVLLEAGSVASNLPFVGAGELTPAPSLAVVPEVTRDLGLENFEASSVALEESDFIVSAGNGVGNVGTFEAFARTFGAAIGASRVAVDDGKFTRDKQIGASGKTVSATTYVAVGISGAVQHLQGIKDCRHVIAINRDLGAPIVKRADLTVVGDAEELMQALIERVSHARAQREMP